MASLDQHNPAAVQSIQQPFAVCPPLNYRPPRGSPHLFESLEQAEAFLASGPSAVCDDPKEQAAELVTHAVDQFVDSHSVEIREALTKEYGKKKLTRVHYQEYVRKNGLAPSAGPEEIVRRLTHCSGTSHDQLGWCSVPVAGISAGESYSKSLRDHHGLSNAGMPTVGTFSAAAAVAEYSTYSEPYTCYLGESWKFDNIASYVRTFSHRGRAFSRLVEVVVAYTLELEDALKETHSNLSGRAVADFWTSYQVRRAIADRCYLLSLSNNETEKLRGDARGALKFVCAQLFDHANKAAIFSSNGCAQPAATTPAALPMTVDVDPFDTQQKRQRVLAEFERANNMGSKQAAETFTVQYTDLRKWVRQRTFGTQKPSSKTTRIEKPLLEFIRSRRAA